MHGWMAMYPRSLQPIYLKCVSQNASPHREHILRHLIVPTVCQKMESATGVDRIRSTLACRAALGCCIRLQGLL